MRLTQSSLTLKGLLLFAPRAILLALLLVYLGCTPAPPAVNKTTPPITPEISLVEHSDPQELFKLVLAEQEKHQRKLRKLQFTSRHERKLADKDDRFTRVELRSVIRDGDSAWCDCYYETGMTESRMENIIQRVYVVWNGHLCFNWGGGTTGAHMYEYSPQTVSKQAKLMMQGPADVYPEQRFAYGTSKDPLSKVSSRDPQKHASRFEAERTTGSDGRVLYTLKGWMNDRISYPKPIWELTVNPYKGYMVTHGEMGDTTSSIKRTITITPKEIAPDTWFPVEWEVLEYYRNPDLNNGEPQLRVIMKYTISDITLNPTIDKDQFTWKAIPMPATTDFQQETESGEIKIWHAVNGELKFKESWGKPVAGNDR